MSTKKSVVETELDDAVAEPGNEKPSTFYWLVVGLHLLVLALGSIPIFFYFQRSMELEHYQFFPIALAVFAYVFYSRLAVGKLQESAMGSIYSFLFLSISCICFGVSIVQYNDYLPTVGAIFTVGSLLICFKDKETNKSLFPVWLLLLPLIRIPLNFDLTLINKLQFISSWLASNVLDFVGISNLTPGAIIQVASNESSEGIKRFDVERACSGVQSLFTLIFCTITVAIWSRRSLVAGAFLVMAGVFWSIAMNSVRIVICVAFYCWFDFDVYSGVKHEILGYLVLFAAVGLIASTDAVLGFVFGPIDVSNENRFRLARLWNRFVAGVETFSNRRRVIQKQSNTTRRICRFVLITLLCFANFGSALVFFNSLTSTDVRRSIVVDQLEFDPNDMPRQITLSSGDAANWRSNAGSFENTVRNTNSTYGPYSSTWQYFRNEAKTSSLVSLDYTFFGWHELRLCYILNGWDVGNAKTTGGKWKSSEMVMSNSNKENAFCIFSMFDYEGAPLTPMDDDVGVFLLKLRSKLARELNTTTAFQVQCFVQSSDPFTEEELDEIRQLHKTSRELLRTKVLEKLKNRDE